MRVKVLLFAAVASVGFCVQSSEASSFTFALNALPASQAVGPFLTYSNLNALSAPGDVDLADSTVTLSNDPGQPNLRLNLVSFTSSDTSSPDLVFSYDLDSTGPSLNYAYLAIAGSRSGSGEGGVTEVITGDGPDSYLLTASLDSNHTASTVLPGTVFHLHYEKDIIVTGGDATDPGSATITTVDNSVPEPATLGLAAVAGLGLLARRRRTI